MTTAFIYFLQHDYDEEKPKPKSETKQHHQTVLAELLLLELTIPCGESVLGDLGRPDVPVGRRSLWSAKTWASDHPS